MSDCGFAGVGIMRPALPVLLLVAGAVGVAVLLVILFVFVPGGTPPSVSACGSEPTAPDYVPLTPHQTRVVFIDFGGGIRVTVWSNASASYALYLQNQTQYSAYAANGSGPKGSMHTTPPSEFYWTSGPETVTNTTFVLGNDTWYLLVANLETSPLVVNLIEVGCTPP